MSNYDAVIDLSFASTPLHGISPAPSPKKNASIPLSPRLVEVPTEVTTHAHDLHSASPIVPAVTVSVSLPLPNSSLNNETRTSPHAQQGEMRPTAVPSIVIMITVIYRNQLSGLTTRAVQMSYYHR